MKPRVYLDDCSYDKRLVRLMRDAGYVVQTPFDAEIAGASDFVHLEYAAHHGYVLLTKNPQDFKDLHDEWQAQARAHAGIWLIYEERDRRKNMTLTDIMHAITNLLASRLPIDNKLHVLNHWR